MGPSSSRLCPCACPACGSRRSFPPHLASRPYRLARAADLQPLEIATKSGVHVFAVEMAVTPEQQAKGLMFRSELPEGQGMLFDFHRDQPASFWMKNTYVSLDMIFIRADGLISGSPRTWYRSPKRWFRPAARSTRCLKWSPVRPRSSASLPATGWPTRSSTAARCCVARDDPGFQEGGLCDTALQRYA